jgi:phenylacetate-CoA ligase
MPNLADKAYWSAFTLWHTRNEAQLPYWEPDRIRALQDRRVREIVKHAYETVPYYREVMRERGLRPAHFQTADDLAQLPVLTGDQLARDPRRFVSSEFNRGPGLVLYSSGTSGRRRVIHYDAAALFLALAHGHRQRLVFGKFVGKNVGYRELVCGRPGNIGTKIRAFYEGYAWTPKPIELERGFLSPEDSFTHNIKKLNEMRPALLSGYGSYVGLLFRYAHENSLPISSPKAIRYGGDKMSDADRALIENQYGVAVVSTYQAAEALRIGFQCEERRGFHMSLDHMAVRVVDQNSKTLGAGETGEIMLSNLTNKGTVLLNYKQGDLVTWSAKPCACGRTLPTIEQIDGRADDLIAHTDGRLLHALVLQAPLHRVPGVIQVQLVQKTLREFLVRVVCIGGEDWNRTQQELEKNLRAILGDSIAVEFEQVEQIPAEAGGKVRGAISELAKESNS